MRTTQNAGTRGGGSGALVGALGLVLVVVTLIGAIAWGSNRFTDAAAATTDLGGPLTVPGAPTDVGGALPAPAAGGAPSGGGESAGSVNPPIPDPDPDQQTQAQEPAQQPKEVTASWGYLKKLWQLTSIDGVAVENPSDPITLAQGDRLRIVNESTESAGACVISDTGGTGLPEPLEGDIELDVGDSALYVVSLNLPKFQYVCASFEAQSAKEFLVATVTVGPASG